MAPDYLRKLINIDKWNAANWRGTAFFVEPTGHVPPGIGLVFENGQAGREIFSDWRKLLGATDTREQLRVAILEGDIPGEDPGYTVHIGPHAEHILAIGEEQGFKVEKSLFLLVSRLQRMNPVPGSPFLDGFKKAYKLTRKYSLLPASMGSTPQDVAPHFDLAIAKGEVYFRKVEDIQPGDPDSVIFLSKKHND